MVGHRSSPLVPGLLPMCGHRTCGCGCSKRPWAGRPSSAYHPSMIPPDPAPPPPVMFVHATLRLKAGATKKYASLINELLPLLAPLGWKLLATYRFSTGPVRTLLNLWQIPDANAFAALPGQISADPRLRDLFAKVEACLEENVLTLMAETPLRS